MAARPLSESTRLDALWRAAIVGTGPEEFFENLIDLLQAAVPTPVALVAFVDEDRLWFKARRGTGLQEIPRERAYSAHAILSDSPLVVPDMSKDLRFRDRIPGPDGRIHTAYAGAPIVLSCGARIGVVCVLHETPRMWSRAEVAHLQRAARMVARHVDARRADLEKDRQRFLEIALQRAETRYEAVMETMTEGMVVQGPSGAIIDSNPAASDMLGLTRDELFGRVSPDPRWRATYPDGSPYPGEDHPSMVTLRTGEPQRDVVLGVETPDGDRRWLIVNSYPVRAPSGRVDQVVSVFRRLDAARPDSA